MEGRWERNDGGRRRHDRTGMGAAEYARTRAYFYQAEDGVRVFGLSRELENVYKRQVYVPAVIFFAQFAPRVH